MDNGIGTPETVTPEKAEDLKLTDVLDIEPSRYSDELYCDYKCRKWWIKRLSKHYASGKTVWVGRDRGEVHNMDRLTRDNKLRRKKDAYNERINEYQASMGNRTIDELNTTKKIKIKMKENVVTGGGK